MSKPKSIEQQFKDLDKLRDKGILREDEYEYRRLAILSETDTYLSRRESILSKRQPDRGRRASLAIFGGIMAIIVVFVVISVATGGNDDPPSQGDSAQPNAAKPGPDVHVVLAKGASGAIAPAGNAGDLSKVTILDIKDPATSANEFEQPADGKKYIGVQVEVENVGTHEVNSLDWKLRDSKDQEHGGDIVSGVGQPLEAFYNLTPGGKTQGWVVFEVDADATMKWLRADPNPFLKNDLYFDAPGATTPAS